MGHVPHAGLARAQELALASKELGSLVILERHTSRQTKQNGAVTNPPHMPPAWDQLRPTAYWFRRPEESLGCYRSCMAQITRRCAPCSSARWLSPDRYGSLGAARLLHQVSRSSARPSGRTVEPLPLPESTSQTPGYLTPSGIVSGQWFRRREIR